MPQSRPIAVSDAFALLALGGTMILAVSYLPPLQPFIVILSSLRLHLIAGIAVMALIMLGLRRPLLAAGYGFVALAAFAAIVVTLLPLTATSVPDEGTRLKVVSFNLQAWNRENGARIADHLMALSPDIAFIQEARPLRTELERLKAVFPYQVGCGAGTRRCDSLLLSRHKLAKPDFYIDTTRAAARFYVTSITLDGQKIALAGLHLTKAEFGAPQQSEYIAAAERIAGIDTPVIAAGDFNTAPWAPRFADFLSETGLKRPILEPATWPTGLGPLDTLGFPIDHILVRGGGFTALAPLESNFGSNHRGLVAELVLAPPGD